MSAMGHGQAPSVAPEAMPLARLVFFVIVGKHFTSLRVLKPNKEHIYIYVCIFIY